MEPIRTLLMDFGPEHSMGQQLAQILMSSVEPLFAITSAHEVDCDVTSATRSLSANLDGNAPALLFFTFERFPSDQIVAPLLGTTRRSGNGSVSIVVTQTGSPGQLAHLVDLGATEAWLAPLRATEVLGRAAHWLNQVTYPEADCDVQALKARLGLEQFIGESPELLIEIQKIPAIASCKANVLIRGETGTGKEICARAIHSLSARSNKPFVPVNCGALPLELLENELFGHAAGAFTSANAAAGGLIEEADGGTLFLDEIDSLPLPAQVKLLRFLQEQQYRPLGSQKTRSADVRIVAATNADLEQLVRAGRLRQDLLFRLNVLQLTLPPVRERGGDTELLARHFLSRYAAAFDKSASVFTAEALRKLRVYAWPGNVRELENVVARAVALSQQAIIGGAEIDLPTMQADDDRTTFKALKARALQTFELRYLTDTLRAHHGNISSAARAAGKERRTFWQLLRKHGLTASRSGLPAERYI